MPPTDVIERAAPMRVVLADDTEDFRTLLRTMLQVDGRFEIVGEADDGAEAVRMTDATHPDAVVLDLAMPVMDGLQALPEIRGCVPHAKIVVLSGFNASQMSAEAVSLGADAYLEKGAAFDRLASLLLEPGSNGSIRPGPEPASQLEGIIGVTRPPEELPREERKPVPVVAHSLMQAAIAAASSAPDLASAFEDFGRVVEEAVPFDRASFAVAIGGGGTFECVATCGRSYWRLPVGTTLALAGRASKLLEGRPIFELDTGDGEGTNAALFARGVRSYVSLPLVVAGETRALINFSSERPQAFSLEEVPLLETLVRETAGIFHILLLLDREREATRRLQEADLLKNDVMGIVAHELRSPMTVIGGFADVMRQRWGMLEEEKKLEFLEAISRNIRDVVRMVEDVLEAASFESGKFQCDIAPFDIAELVRGTVAELGVAHPDRTCTVRLPEDLPPALGDVQRQRQILSNLLCNAFKFSSPSKAVEVSVELDDAMSMARVSVRDEGVGIDGPHLSKIFEKFYRVVGDGGRKPSGSGLGLYICKLLVEAQRGRIWAESGPAAGSAFTYTVPVERRRRRSSVGPPRDSAD